MDDQRSGYFLALFGLRTHALCVYSNAHASLSPLRNTDFAVPFPHQTLGFRPVLVD